MPTSRARTPRRRKKVIYDFRFGIYERLGFGGAMATSRSQCDYSANGAQSLSPGHRPGLAKFKNMAGLKGRHRLGNNLRLRPSVSEVKA